MCKDTLNCEGRDVYHSYINAIPITNGNRVYGAMEIFKDVTQVNGVIWESYNVTGKHYIIRGGKKKLF